MAVQLDNLEAFTLSLGAFIDENKEEAVTIHRLMTLKALAGVMKKTPVDTGRARGNWQATVGRPFSGSKTELEEDFDERKNSDYDLTRNTAKAEKRLRRLEFAGKTFVTNNVEYIEFLEGGSSGQSPNGMLDVTLRELIREFT